MALFALVFFVVALVLIGVGMALGLVACVVATILLSVGIVSSSIFVAVRSGRAAAGIRAFLVQCGILAGIPAGAVCAWLAKSFFEAYGQDTLVLVYGGIGGACAGLIIALLLDSISRRAQTWASTRLLPSRSQPDPTIDRT
jgi:hypothetical protein